MPNESVRLSPGADPSEGTGVGAGDGASDGPVLATVDGAVVGAMETAAGLETALDGLAPDAAQPVRSPAIRRMASPRGADATARGSGIGECYPPLAYRHHHRRPAHVRAGRAGARRGWVTDAAHPRSVPYPGGRRRISRDLSRGAIPRTPAHDSRRGDRDRDGGVGAARGGCVVRSRAALVHPRSISS